MPPACDARDSSPSTICEIRGSRSTCHSGAIFIQVFLQPKDTIFFYPPKTARSHKTGKRLLAGSPIRGVTPRSQDHPCLPMATLHRPTRFNPSTASIFARAG
jgi:hypothetical protein